MCCWSTSGQTYLDSLSITPFILIHRLHRRLHGAITAISQRTTSLFQTVYLETDLEGQRRRLGHLWEYRHAAAQPKRERAIPANAIPLPKWRIGENLLLS